MKSRTMVVTVAVVFAVAAATTVGLYLQSVRADARTGGGDVSVLFATHDIPAGTKAADLFAEESVATRSVARVDVINGAVTDEGEITGLQTTSPILAGEQVTLARFEGSTAKLGGGTLGLPPGYQAIGVSLKSARAAGGAIQPGDHVTVYATFTGVLGDTGRTADVTLTLVPDAQVLAVSAPTAVDASSSDITVTLALKQAKAARLVFSQERGSVWLGLLAPNESGAVQGPVGFQEAAE
jgi:Flp pilus assembly protein CpaB